MLLDVDSEACPCCGGALHAIGESVSEMLDWVPAQLRVHPHPPPEIRLPRLRQRSSRRRRRSGRSPAAWRRRRCSPRCWSANTAITLPLYRQSQIFARHGVELDRSTLADWVGGACWWLEALHERLCKHVFASDHLFADDTPIPVLDPGRGRTKTGRLWVYARDQRPGADPSRRRRSTSTRRIAGPSVRRRISQHFKGVLQVDGYAGFERLTGRGDIVLAACWAHTRRKFYEVPRPTGSPIATEALRRIAELYAVEATRPRPVAGASAGRATGAVARPHRRRAEDLAGSPAAAARRPQHACRGDPLRARALGRADADSSMTAASNSTPIPVERAIRPVALGRKNHLFAGSDGGGDALGDRLLADRNRKLNDVEPYAYLRDVLTRMVDGHPINRLDELLPWTWKRRRITSRPDRCASTGRLR